MKRRTLLRGIGAAVSAISLNLVSRRAGAQELPEGVPEGSLEVLVTGHEDGDKFTITGPDDDAELTVLMISANAPEEGRCFFNASSKHLRELIPVGTTVYLEFDGDEFDGKGRLLCYVWKPRDGEKAQFIDERMIADGYSRFTPREGHTKRDARLKKAEEIAKSEKRGMWADGACSGGSSNDEQESADNEQQTDASESGEPGFSHGLGQSRDDWEAIHGEPNPEFTRGDSFVYYGVRNNYMIVMYIDGNVHSISGVTPELQVSDVEAFLLGFSPDDAVLLEQYTSAGGLVTNVYFSESLISRINEGFWFNAEPGVFITGYHVSPETGLAESWLVATGNNP